MSNAKLKEGLGEIARTVAVLPGVPPTDVEFVGQKVSSISAKIDKTNGMDIASVPPQVESLNPKPACAASSPGSPMGIVGVLAALPMLTELASGEEEWLCSVGVASHESDLDGEQGTHSDALDDLHQQSCDCADSVKDIDESADCGIQATIDVILDLLAALKDCPLVALGSTVLAPILEGLVCIEGTVDDRNDSIDQCYDGLEQLCDGAGETTPPATKQYTPAGECPPAPASAPVPEACPPAPPAPPAHPAPEHVPAPPVAECPPEQAPRPAELPEPVADAPALSQVTVPAAAGLDTGVNINVNVDVDVTLGADGAVQQTPVAQTPVAQTVPAQCPNSFVPAPPAVPPIGPAGDCVVNHVIAGLEAFGQSVAECLAQIECPAEPVVDCPEPEPEPDCPEEKPEPEPEPEPDCPEDKPEPVQEQPECPEGTIPPPPELAEVKEPPPPPKKALMEAAAVSGAEAVPEQQEMQVEAPVAEQPAETPAEKAQPEQAGESHRARKTGGW